MTEEWEKLWIYWLENRICVWIGMPLEDREELNARLLRWHDWKRRQRERLEETNELTYEKGETNG